MLNTVRKKYNQLSSPIKAALWYTICNFINKGIALLTTPIFTRLLTEEQFGIYSIYQSWINIIIIFTSLNLFMSSYTKGLIEFKDDQDNFTSSQIGLVIFLTLIFSIFYLFNMNFISYLLKMPKILIFGMIIELFCMPIIEFWLAKERFDYKYKSIIFITISMNILCLLFGVITILLSEYKIEARIFSNAFVKFVFIIPLFGLLIKNSRKLINWKYWKYALLFNIPLIPHYLSHFILTQSDRIMIGRLVGNSEAAYYSVAYTIATVVVLLITATNNALTPYVYKSIENDEIDNIKKNMNPIILIMGCLVVLIMIFAPEIIYLFAGKNYMDSIYVIPPVAASVYFIYIYSLFSNVEYFYKKTVLIAFATTICAIINIILNFFCIKKFGYYSAGYTTLVCYLLLALFHYVAYRIVLKEKLPNIKNIYDLKLISVCSGFVLLLMLIMVLTYNSFIIRYSVLILILILMICYKNKILNTIKNFKSNKE